MINIIGSTHFQIIEIDSNFSEHDHLEPHLMTIYLWLRCLTRTEPRKCLPKHSSLYYEV